MKYHPQPIGHATIVDVMNRAGGYLIIAAVLTTNGTYLPWWAQTILNLMAVMFVVLALVTALKERRLAKERKRELEKMAHEIIQTLGKDT